ncbi:MAG: hypothetical protein HYR60_12160 [Acidobacteria bacterium]|nr:hypothetical protein [Acidobacteriota bacterium]
MATTKVTVTLQDNQVEGIRALVAAGQAASVSAFVKHAAGVALFGAAGWKEMMEDALQQTGGPLTKKERAWADALLPLSGIAFDSGGLIALDRNDRRVLIARAPERGMRLTIPAPSADELPEFLQQRQSA